MSGAEVWDPVRRGAVDRPVVDRTRILEKTTLKSNVEIIRYTVEHGLVH